MKNLIAGVAIVLAFAFIGCKAKKEIVYLPSVTVTQTDTVTNTVTIVERDTVIKKEASEASASIPLKDIQKGFKSDFKSKDAGGSIQERDGNLNIKCTCDSLGLLVKLKDKKIHTLEQRLKETNTSHPVQYTPWYVKVLAWVGGIFLVLLLVVLIGKKLKLL